MIATSSRPTLDLDPFCADFLADPYPGHAQMRDAGPVVWLEKYGIWAMARHAEVSAALSDWQTYCSARGVGLSDFAALRLVVLPQALTAVVPALVNIMIAVIKETTLLSVIGVNDMLGAVETGAKSPDWVGESNILTSGHVFLAIAYLSISLSLSRYSRRLETRR